MSELREKTEETCRIASEWESGVVFGTVNEPRLQEETRFIRWLWPELCDLVEAVEPYIRAPLKPTTAVYNAMTALQAKLDSLKEQNKEAPE